MGRYSFFISNSFLSGYSVHAVGELDNDLSNTSEQYSNFNSDISSNDQNSLYSDNVVDQSEEVQNYETSTETPEENSNEIGLEYPDNQVNRPQLRIGDPVSWASITKYSYDLGLQLTTRTARNIWDIEILNQVYTNLKNSVNAHDNWTANVQQPQINKIQSDLGILNSAYIATRNQVNSHDQWVANTLLPIVNKTKSDLSVLNSAFIDHRNWVNNVQQKDIKILNQAFVDHRNWVNNVQQPQIEKNEKDLKVLNSAFIEVRDHVKSHDKWVADTLVPVLDKTKSDLTTLNSAFVNHRDWVNNVQQPQINKIEKDSKILNDAFIATRNEVNAHINWVKSAQQPQIDQNTADIEELKKGFTWSDIGIITALGLVKDSIDSFKTAFTDLFSVDDLVGLSAHEGKFTRMIKSQFIALRNDLRDLFKSYFGVEMDGEIPTPTGLFSKLLDDLIYKVRYTTIQEFSELKELLEAQSTIFLESLNLVNDSLLAIRKNQIAISEWLKLIYEKPVGNVIAPPFDFDRLAKIIADNMPEMGGGESGWLKQAIKTAGDIIKTGIETMGELLGKGIDGLVDIASKILDFLDGLIDKLLALIIPDNWDFLDKGFGDISKEFNLKFKLFLDLGGTIKDIFTPNKKDFFSAVSWSYLGVTFDGQEAKPIMDQFVPRFRTLAQVSIWLMVAWWVYRKVTGSGDLINDN